MKILTVLGARPQFVKASPVSQALARASTEEVLVHTGQHHDPELSQVFFDELELAQPRHHLGVHGVGHGAMTGRMLERLETVMGEEQPDVVLVYGDTNSTLAGALAAAKLHYPIAHVEAGLRSFNRAMPEEINRVITDHVATLLLCPTSVAVRNLASEGITSGVQLVGDVMYDAALRCRQRALDTSTVLTRLGLQEGNYAVATVHRAENTDDPDCLDRVMTYLSDQAVAQEVVLILHPRTRNALERAQISPQRVRVLPSQPYIDMTRLVAGATLILTDSGGLQKEAYFHRVPCVTLRSETEWTETVEAGWNRLWTCPDWKPRREINEYGHGDAADRVAELILKLAK